MASFDSIINAIQSKLDREINLFNIEFEKVLDSINIQVAKVALDKADPLNFDYVFQTILQQSGYYELINKFIDTAYDKNYKDILAIFKEGGIDISFSQDDLTKIAELKTLDIQTFRDIGNQAGLALKKDLYKYSLSNMTIKDLTTNIRQSLAGTDLAKYSKTYAETSISNFNQAIINMKAQDADGVWIYVGVNDGRTRPFCKHILEAKRYYTDSEKIALEGDSRRQWRCRHQFLKISEDSAKRRGYDG